MGLPERVDVKTGISRTLTRVTANGAASLTGSGRGCWNVRMAARVPFGVRLMVVWLALSMGGCVPTRSTIGGHDEAELARWADEARQACIQRTRQDPPYQFTTDGCTLSPDCTWQSCCVEHDKEYWCGGSAEDRLHADQRLRSCISEHGGPRISTLMYWFVRPGGHPWLPTYWRWGYGWPWPYRGQAVPGSGLTIRHIAPGRPTGRRPLG